MKVFKFGGASVGNVESIKNVGNIISEYSGQPLIVVVSAMGKTTNALEKLADAFFKGEPTPQLFEGIRQYHYQIITELFGDDLAKDAVGHKRFWLQVPCPQS